MGALDNFEKDWGELSSDEKCERLLDIVNNYEMRIRALERITNIDYKPGYTTVRVQHSPEFYDHYRRLFGGHLVNK